MEAEIGDIKLTLIESIMEEATRLPRNGESWFKNKIINENGWVYFLIELGMDLSVFKKGILFIALKGKWRNRLLIIQKIVTCE